MTVIGGVYFRSQVSLNRAVILPRIVQEIIHCCLTIGFSTVGQLKMAIRTRRLTGPGRLLGEGFDGQIHYSLMHRSEDISAPRLDDITETVIGSTNDTITGRVEMPPGFSVPQGQTMVLTLHDGTKLRVVAEADGRVTGTGGFFR